MIQGGGSIGLPTGTVTFLFTDIEGSTKLAQEHPDQWEDLRARHHAILRSAMDACNGYVFQIIGDAFCVAFHTASDGLNAAIEAQRQLQREDWGEQPIKVRMGLHTGEAEIHDDEYRGYLTMSLVQRLMSAGHGGQILLSNATGALARSQLSEDIQLRDLGEYKFKDMLQPMHVFQIVAPDIQSEFPPLRAPDVFPNNLPVQLTSFVGRNKEIGQIKKRLEQYRLVTLTGSGGVGKSRLSIRVASEVLTDYPDGAWLVELAPVTDPALVTQTVCAALDVTPSGNTPALNALTDYLQPKKTLLVVDNCEHLIDACAQLTDGLLHACPNLRIIASSREALGIEGESAYRVPSLSLPYSHADLQAIEKSEAVQLFIERANALLPDFALTGSNAPVIAQICQRLDGIALAIELAASRVRILKVEQIASRLDDAFRLLTGGARTVLPRHQTLRGTIDWSYNLLTNVEQEALRRLSVFVDGWTLDAAETICNNPNMLDLLTHLVDKSLVAVDFERGDELRYYLLETIRQYANEKLVESGESDALRNKHLDYFLNLAETAEPKLFTAEQVKWFNRLEAEHDNLRAALDWVQASGRTEAGLRLTGALWWFWLSRGYYSEGEGRLRQNLSQSAATKSTWARAKALNALGFFQWTLANYTEASHLLEDALALGLELSDPLTTATALRHLGGVAIGQGDYTAAHSFLERSLAIWRELGNKYAISFSLMIMGDLALYQSNDEQAQVQYEESVILLRELGNKNELAYPVRRLGQIALRRGDTENAMTLWQESLIINWEVGEKRGIAASMTGLAGVAAARGHAIHAAQLIGAIGAILDTIMTTVLPADQVVYDSVLVAVRTQLDEATFAKACAEGRELTMEQAIAFALEENS